MIAAPNPVDVLRARGFVRDVTDEAGLRRLFDAEQVTYYVGFDPTGPSLHIGHLVGMMAMAHLQRLGHRPIALAGGATGRIGDPSFRDEERALLGEDQLAANLAGIRRQLGQVIDLQEPGAASGGSDPVSAGEAGGSDPASAGEAGGSDPASAGEAGGSDPASAGEAGGSNTGLLVDNYEWTRDVSVLDFLRDVGKHFSVNAMIAKESVRKRLTEREQGISFTEFSYQLLQAYDFAMLHERHGCRLQGGGTDQWGNITAGIELTRRVHDTEVYGIVWPLIERSDGRKFSKSTGAAVWLDPRMTSAYAYYQWFLNVPDADVVRFLKLFTFLDLDEIEALERELAADPAARVAHRALASEATRIIHGDQGVAAAQRASAALFGAEPFSGLDDGVLADAFEEAPSVELDRARLDDGIGLLGLMVEVGAAASNGEARRLVEQGGVRVNNAPVADPTRTVGRADLAGQTTLVLRVGKRRHYLARFR